MNGRRVEPDMISSTATPLTTDCSICDMKEQIWQCGSWHSGAFLLAKSDGTFDEPARWRTVTWYRATTDRNDVKRGLDENSPRPSLSMA